MEQGGTVGRSQPWLYRELEASLGYAKPYINQNTKRNVRHAETFIPDDYRNKNSGSVSVHTKALIERMDPGKERMRLMVKDPGHRQKWTALYRLSERSEVWKVLLVIRMLFLIPGCGGTCLLSQQSQVTVG